MKSQTVLLVCLSALLTACTATRSGSGPISSRVELKVLSISVTEARQCAPSEEIVLVPVEIQLRNKTDHDVVIVLANIDGLVSHTRFYDTETRTWWCIPLLGAGTRVDFDDSTICIRAKSEVSKKISVLAGGHPFVPVNDHLISVKPAQPIGQRLFHRLSETINSPAGYEVLVQGTGRAEVR